MKAALRVLTALSDRQEPDPADVDELHWYAPAERARPLDELVCDAIQRALKDREQKRKAAKAEIRERVLAMTSGVPERIAVGAGSPGDVGRESAGETLIRQARERRDEYRALTGKLRRVGIALQQAADAGGSTKSENARDMLASVAGEVDLSGITQLLNEHARLRRQMIEDEQALKKLGVQ